MEEGEIEYDVSKLVIQESGIHGVRIDVAHGGSQRVKSRLYIVSDKNLPWGGNWIVELFEKKMKETDGGSHKATFIRVLLAPHRAPNSMVAITRQSITFQSGKMGKYKGKPYVDVTYRKPDSYGGKRLIMEGEEDLLPSWFTVYYKDRIRRRPDVVGKSVYKTERGRNISRRVHDRKLVVVFDEWDDCELIRYYFIMRVFSAFHGYEIVRE